MTAGTAGLALTSPTLANDPCAPVWAEDVGLPASFMPRVSDLVAFDDGSGETLYAGGLFDVGPPDEKTGAVRWNGQTWEALQPQGANDVASSKLLTVYNGELWAAGGYFLNGQWYRVARWDSTADDWIPESNPIGQFFNVFDGDTMVAFDGALYIGGRYNNTQGIGSGKFSRYDGTTWGAVPNLPAGLDLDNVTDMVVFDGELYVAFTNIFDGGRIYKLTSDGDPWVQVGLTVPEFSQLAVFQNNLYIAGTNNSFLLPPVTDHVLQLSSTGDNWVPILSPSSDSFAFINDLVSADDGTGESLFVAGEIESFGGVSGINHIAKWDGQSWSALGGGVSLDPSFVGIERVTTLYEWNDGSGSALWIGGEFDEVDNISEVIASSGIAKWSCEPPAVDPALSDVLVDELAISSFAGQTRVTVVPRDGDGLLLDAGQGVFVNATAGTLLGAVQDQGNGTYTQYLEGDVGPAGATVSAIVNGVELDDTVFVAFVPVEPSLSTIDVSVDETFVGGSAVVTVTPVDDLGQLVGTGFDVQINTTLGQLVDNVTDNGDGTYSQTILADQPGTASITATVDGMALNTGAALSILDPAIFGNIIGVDEDGNSIGYMSIQAAIDNAEPGGTIFIAPGVYEETLVFYDIDDLVIEGLSAYDPVVIRGAVFADSNDVSIRFVTIDADNRFWPRNAVVFLGWIWANNNIEILGSTITNAKASGVLISRNNENVSIVDTVITNNGRHGIYTRGNSGDHLVFGSTITDNGWTGVDIDRNVVMTLAYNVITGNGGFFNNANPNGYGIFRGRKGGGGTPGDVTLIQNTLDDNNGRTHPGRSDSNVGNYDQIIDATDDQSPYTD